jgi:hypothetical protein
VGVCVGVGVGVGDALTTVTIPVIPKLQFTTQKYGKDPTVLKVWSKVEPWLRTPESQSPLGEHEVPDVVL